MPLVSPAALVAAARSGSIVSFPTDTVPALAVLPKFRQDLYTLKARSPEKPLILMASTIVELLQFIDTDRSEIVFWRAILAQYLPGAVTFILPVNTAGQELNPGQQTIGIRVPSSQIAIGILQQTGPLLTTSANPSNAPPLRSMPTIAQTFPEVAVWGSGDPAILHGSGCPSTVVCWQEGTWQVLREGAVVIEL